MNLQKEKNKLLVEEYPFLLPRNVFTDELASEYDYEFTWLDEMPETWKNAFGLKMCQELKEVLIKTNSLNDFRIQQIKEKYGTLRVYSNFINDEIERVIRKYEEMSMMFCIKCGKPTRWISKWYIAFLCDNCKDENCERLTERDVPRYTTFTKNSHYITESIFKEEMIKQWS